MLSENQEKVEDKKGETVTNFIPYYKDEFSTIYGMDCEIGMKQMENNSIDLIVTDPPY